MFDTKVIDEFDLKKTLSKNHIKGLWRLMAGYHWTFLAANGSLAISALFKTSTFLFLGYFVDNILGKPEYNRFLVWIALLFVAFASLEGIFTYFSGRLAAFTAEGIIRRLRNYLYDHIQRLSFSYHATIQTGDLIQRSTSDVDAIRRFYSEQAVGIGRIILLFSINFTALVILNAPLALFSIIAIPIVFLLSLFFFKRIGKAYEAYQAQEAVLTTTLQENLSGVRVVKAFARQNYEEDKFEKDNWKKYLRGRYFLLMHSYFWPITDIICGFQMLAGFTLGALMTINGAITIGTYISYAGLVVWLIWPVRNIGRLIVHASQGMVSFGRVQEIISQDREPLDEGDYLPLENLRGDFLFDNVCFDYGNGDGNVIYDISFSCAQGDTIALLGSTGSGKSTLVNLLPRFYDYSCGHIILDGIELTRYPRKYLRDQIGIVEQEPFLFSRSIYENIAFGVTRQVSKEEVEEAARLAAIHDVILTFPDGYQTIIGEKGVTLSGGQKQRVAIARTLLKNPRILILDDSTSSVDTETESEIRTALEYLMLNRTTFVIAHRIQSVMNADLILVMDDGRIIQMGKHEDLQQEDGVYKKIYEIQTLIEAELENEIFQSENVSSTNP